MSTPADKANLARIRDNQRRSRARRKAYLQELERRLRLCELQGVEASAEIQMAARKVADENKKLRALLNKQGMCDDFIESYVQTGGAGDMAQHRIAPNGQSVQTLEQLLAPRRPSCIDPTVPFPMIPRTIREPSIMGPGTWDAGLSPPPMARQLPSNAPPQTGRISPTQHYTGPSSLARGDTLFSTTSSGMGSSLLDDHRQSNRSPPTSMGGDGHSPHVSTYDVSMQTSYSHLPNSQQSGYLGSESRDSSRNNQQLLSGSSMASSYATATTLGAHNVLSSMASGDGRGGISCGPSIDAYGSTIDRYGSVVSSTGTQMSI